MPLISKHFPGINPFTVDELTVDWWLVYVAQAEAIVKGSEQARGSAQRSSR